MFLLENGISDGRGGGSRQNNFLHFSMLGKVEKIYVKNQWLEAKTSESSTSSTLRLPANKKVE